MKEIYIYVYKCVCFYYFSTSVIVAVIQAAKCGGYMEKEIMPI